MFKWFKEKFNLDKNKDIKKDIEELKQDSKELKEDIKEEIIDKKEEIKDEVIGKTEEFKDEVIEKKEEIKDEAEETKENIAKEFEEKKDKINKNLEEVKKDGQAIKDLAKDEIKEDSDKLKEEISKGKDQVIKDFDDKKKELEKDISKIEEVKEEKSKEIKKETEKITEELKHDFDESLDIIEGDIKEVTKKDEESSEKPKKKPNFFQKLVSGLTKTRDQMTDKIDDILASYHKIDEDLFYDLEEALVIADVGVETTMKLIDGLKERVQKGRVTDPNEVKNLLKEEIKELMKESVDTNELKIEPSPSVILVVGVNGVGKTTTIGKLSNSLKEDGKKVLMAAGDTFRAAAIEQLEEWSNRSGVEIISHSEGADPGAVIFDGIHAAKARKADVLICDTAGRLHNKANLMNELGKIFKILEREYPEATKEVLLVLDATTGQNAINQAKTFKEVANITGVALTKLDGTAKGGVVIALQAELGLPIKLIGVGEGIYDLQPFNTDDFVDALFN
ncbi:MAG TPA: signal recognition particle-docking protein FtsY [Tissierellaceae bacterium]